MANVIKLKKGLTVNLVGKPSSEITVPKSSKVYGLVPDAFVGVKPKVVVKEGETVKAGDALFVDKLHPEVKFTSPVSGKVVAVARGDRRKVLSIQVEADATQSYADFGKLDLAKATSDDVMRLLLEAGLFAYINQRPYAVVANPEDKPKAIFCSTFCDMPLAADFEVALKGNEAAFQAGIDALAKIAPVYLGAKRGAAVAILKAENAKVTVFDGKCPAGNVGVQINHLNPVNKGEVVWTIGPEELIFIGKVVMTGKVDFSRIIAVAGSEIQKPAYAKVRVGQRIGDILDGNVKSEKKVRLIDGNPLTGTKTELDNFLMAHTTEVTAIPEGDDADEAFGWIMPRFKQFSSSRTYFSWLMGKKKEYVCDARIKGGYRHMIMSGEYDSVFPMDIFPEQLVKAIIAGDIDRMEALGIYEVAPEDFAMAEFVDSSKLELQRIVREGLDMLRKENA
ncbi:MAG: Na(+)-translocating NADH-quinone reductase subunit A [Bacteroidaceae bacterium]|nr:Na(+)-translocating NADH-quinone reductase subunit A [Bacteroidaceae bacterium]